MENSGHALYSIIYIMQCYFYRPSITCCHLSYFHIKEDKCWLNSFHYGKYYCVHLNQNTGHEKIIIMKRNGKVMMKISIIYRFYWLGCRTPAVHAKVNPWFVLISIYICSWANLTEGSIYLRFFLLLIKSHFLFMLMGSSN